MDNAETVQRSLQGLKLFMAMLVNSMSLLRSSPSPSPSPSPSEGENENEYDLRCSLAVEPNNSGPCQTVLLMRRNSYPRRGVPGAMLSLNVNIFNFSLEPISSNIIFAPLLPILLSFLQSSGTTPSPFELRPLAFMVSVACSVAYYLTMAAKFVLPGFASQLEVVVSLFGSLAVATLISLTLQFPWWSILFILLFIGGFFGLLSKLHATYANIRRPLPRTMQPLLPLYNVIFTH